jgi:hypothetical protein
MSCGISPPFEGLSPTSGQVTHVLLTRLPRYRGLPPFAFDLHVLGTPPAFVLSQDQTLQLICGTGVNAGSHATEVDPADAARGGDPQILRSIYDSFCKAGTFYLVFKERRTGKDETHPRWDSRRPGSKNPFPCEASVILAMFRGGARGCSRIFLVSAPRTPTAWTPPRNPLKQKRLLGARFGCGDGAIGNACGEVWHREAG